MNYTECGGIQLFNTFHFNDNTTKNQNNIKEVTKLIFVEELRKNRKVFILERNKNVPCIHTGLILGIVKSGDSHYLRVLTEQEIIRVQISGNTLPNSILSSSIFFDASTANLELNNYKAYLKTHTPKVKSEIMGL